MWGNSTLFHQEKSIKKILRKDKYRHNQLREVDSLTTNNLIHG